MSGVTVLSIDMIVSNPKIRNGRPIIAGTTLRVQDIVAGYLYKGYSVDDLVKHYPQIRHTRRWPTITLTKMKSTRSLKQMRNLHARQRTKGLDSDIRLYFDESVEVEVAEQMKQHGIDAVTVRDLGLLGDTDINHLRRATEMGRVLCTYDTDFLRIAAEGVEHAGIVFGFHAARHMGIGYAA